MSNTVTYGDKLNDIAARLNLTVNDLLYLNPARSTGSNDHGAHPGEQLNLIDSGR